MRSNLFGRKGLLSMAFIACGAPAIIVALSPELVGRGGQPGFSVKQIMLAAVGLISILSGVGVASPAGRRYIKNCLTTVGLYEQQLTVTRLVLMSIWFGLLAGLGEVSILGFQKFVLRSHLQLVNPNTFWMAPLAETAVVTVFGLFLVLIARRWPSLLALRIVASVFGFLGFLSLLLMFQTQIHILAVLLQPAWRFKLADLSRHMRIDSTAGPSHRTIPDRTCRSLGLVRRRMEIDSGVSRAQKVYRLPLERPDYASYEHGPQSGFCALRRLRTLAGDLCLVVRLSVVRFTVNIGR